MKKKEVKEKKENTKRLGMWSGLLDLKKERKKTERKERMDDKNASRSRSIITVSVCRI